MRLFLGSLNRLQGVEWTAFVDTLDTLRPFIGVSQMSALAECCRGEEREWFVATLNALAERIRDMPKPYDTTAQGSDAIAHLHYFGRGADCFITERDAVGQGETQLQAFGRTCIHECELGYVCIQELLAAGTEIDLHWDPKPLSRCRK